MANSKTAGKSGDKTIIELLSVSDIDDQNIIQLREKRSEATVQEYADIYREHPKGTLPPIVVFRTALDDQRNLDIVADGDHRIRAARAAELKRIEAEIRYGDRDAAVLYACGCNARHGLRRTHADLRNTVQTLLSNPKWAKRSDNWLAKTVGCSHTFVGKIREQLSTCNAASPAAGSEREASDGRRMRTRHIGRRKAATPGVASERSPAPAPTPDETTDRSPAPAARRPVDDDPCRVCGVGIRADGERCQRCIDEGRTPDEEEALRVQAGAARPDIAAAIPRRRSPSQVDASGPKAPELQRSGDGVESLDAELVKLGFMNQHYEPRKWTKGKLLKAARLIVQRLEAETMPPDVRHCARLLGMVLDGFKRLRTK